MDDPNDFLDGCDLDFEADPDDDLTASLRPLFPTGDPGEFDWSGVDFDAP